MASRITLLVLMSKTGVPRRLSINKYLLYCLLILLAGLLASGILGALRHQENLELKKEYQLLEAKRRQMEAVSRSVAAIAKEEKAIRQLLGLEAGNTAQAPAPLDPNEEPADQVPGRR
jgi:hypothetical protein